MVGVRFQQLQKYETGKNRVSGSRLWELAQALNVPVTDFFPEHEPSGMTDVGNEADLRLMRAIMGLDAGSRDAVKHLVASIGKDGDAASENHH
jgi:transcriptional regulator with XRE-family HTH domain